MRNTILKSGFALLLLSGNLLWAQEKESDLDPVTVTSSLSQVKSSQTGRNMIIIKGEKFSELPVHSESRPRTSALPIRL